MDTAGPDYPGWPALPIGCFVVRPGGIDCCSMSVNYRRNRWMWGGVFCKAGNNSRLAMQDYLWAVVEHHLSDAYMCCTDECKCTASTRNNVGCSQEQQFPSTPPRPQCQSLDLELASPPSTPRTCPVTKLARSLSRYSKAYATSSGVPTR